MSVRVLTRAATLVHPSRRTLPTPVTHGVVQVHVASVYWLYNLAETASIVAGFLVVESGCRLSRQSIRYRDRTTNARSSSWERNTRKSREFGRVRWRNKES